MSTQTEPYRPRFNTVMTTLALCLPIAIALYYAFSEQHRRLAETLYDKANIVLRAGAVLLLPILISWWTHKRKNQRFRFSLLTVLTITVFLGVMCLTNFFTGGLLPLSVACAVLALALVVVTLLRWGKDEIFEPLVSPFFTSQALAAVVGAFGIISFLCAFTPPWEYDEQEYHLGSVAYYKRHPDAWCVPGNVYSHFPQLVEAGYFLAIPDNPKVGLPAQDHPRQTSTVLNGVYTAKLINAFLGLLTALLVGWATRRCSDAHREGIAANISGYAIAFFYCSPAILVFSAICFVEMALTFCLFLAFCVFLVYADIPSADAPKRLLHAALCGIIAGLAASCKYTGILFGIVPLFFLFIVHGMMKSRRTLHGFIDAGLFLLAALIVLSPWFLRNFFLTGNPMFPLMHSIFGGQGWDAAHAAMWAKAHAPGPITLEAFGQSFRDGFVNSPLTPILSFLFIPLLILRPKAISSPARWVLAYAILYSALWFTFTHRAERFLSPALPMLAVLSALGFAAWKEGWVGKALKGLVALCLAFTLYHGLILGANFGAFSVALFPDEREKFFRENTDFYDVYRAIQFLNENIKDKKTKVLFFAETRAFYCEGDWLAPTVFNTHPLETALQEGTNVREVAVHLERQGFTHLLVNWAEFERLHKTYGAFKNFDFRRWAAFRDQCLHPLGVFGKPNRAGDFPIVVYALKK